MEFEFGDVILVPFPFTDQRASKRRPAVVISGRQYNTERQDVIIMAITSQPNAGSFDAKIAEWREAGLVAPSTVKPVVTTIEKTLVIKTLGRLTTSDRTGLPRLLSSMLGAS